MGDNSVSDQKGAVEAVSKKGLAGKQAHHVSDRFSLYRDKNKTYELLSAYNHSSGGCYDSQLRVCRTKIRQSAYIMKLGRKSLHSVYVRWNMVQTEEGTQEQYNSFVL